MPPSLRGAAARPGGDAPGARAPSGRGARCRAATWRGSTWRPGRCMLALVIRRRSSPLSAIHLASTSSESGSRARAVGLGLVRELDAVLVQQAAGLRQVGDDRLVRVDQVGVRDALEVRPARLSCGRRRLAAPHADEPEVAVHRPLLLVHARLQELAGALLGAALAAGVVRGDLAGARAASRRARRRSSAALEPGDRDLPEQRDDRRSPWRRGRRSPRGYCAPPAARGKKMTRPVSRGISSNALHHLGLPPAGLAC